MFRSKELALCIGILAVSAVAKPPPAAGMAPWMSYASKPVYSRSLGPPAASGMDTISVPYLPKSPFFPKFVDPKAMIAKKTDILANLFGGLGPAGWGPPLKPVGPALASGSTSYSSHNDGDGILENPQADATNINGLYKRGTSTFVPSFVGKEAEVRRRRSVGTSPDGDKSSVAGQSPPPPYPAALKPIPEEPESLDEGPKKSIAAVPKEYMPGMFGPFGPGGPFGPAVDPSMFISKKSAFLDTLFKNLATTATPTAAVTEEPVPQSTIVPPNFWLPTSVIPSPTEYNQKVSDFLDKLFESLKLNTTATSDESSAGMYRSVSSETDGAQGRITRSLQDLSSISAAKDTIVDTILSELGGLKGDMIKTLNDLIVYEKTVAADATPSKKPFKPFAGGLWPKPTVDPTLPFQQRMAALSQVFDMLSDLQRNITEAIGQAMKTDTTAESTETPNAFSYSPIYGETGFGWPIYNESLLDAVRKKLEGTNAPVAPKTFTTFGTKTARTLPKTGSSFWVAYPESTDVKRQATNDNDAVAVGEGLAGEEDGLVQQDRRPHARAVQMQMHQGYQSLPAGAVETVQAGGGSVPGHQGGGIKLLDTSYYKDYDKWADWTRYVDSQDQGRRHHHNH